MLLHSDRYFDHIYETKFDLLTVNWMTIETVFMPEILHSVQQLVANIKNYDIRNLLIDASGIHEHSSEQEHEKVVDALFGGLAKSRLKKLARIASLNKIREFVLKEKLPALNQECDFEIRLFGNFAEADAWLKLPDFNLAAA